MTLVPYRIIVNDNDIVSAQVFHQPVMRCVEMSPIWLHYIVCLSCSVTQELGREVTEKLRTTTLHVCFCYRCSVIPVSSKVYVDAVSTSRVFHCRVLLQARAVTL